MVVVAAAGPAWPDDGVGGCGEELNYLPYRVAKLSYGKYVRVLPGVW